MRWFKRKKKAEVSTEKWFDPHKKTEVFTDHDVVVDPDAEIIREGDPGYSMLMKAMETGQVMSGTRNDDGTWDVETWDGNWNEEDEDVPR